VRIVSVVAAAQDAIRAQEEQAGRECEQRHREGAARQSFVASFYGRLSATIRERFGASEDEAREFCAARRAEVLAGGWASDGKAMKRLVSASIGGTMNTPTREVFSIPEDTFRLWSAAAEAVNPEVVAALDAATLVPGRSSVGSVAILSVRGYVSQRPSAFSFLFGGVSTEALAREVESLVADPSVGAIILDVDSPGGTVSGVPEAAARLRALRGSKPIVALTNALNASAAYWMTSQADAVYSTPSGFTGSIGVYTMHLDMSAALERDGLKVRIVKYGQRKADANPYEPLSEEALAAMQADVDYFGALFEADVAKGRRVSASRVNADFGQGSTFTAAAALEAGLVDGISTLDDLVAKLGRGWKPSAKGGALMEPALLTASVETETTPQAPAAAPLAEPFDLRSLDWQAKAWGV
jgi:signal peptide peptidase SppA